MTKVVAIGAGHGKHTPGKRTPAGEREWYFNDKVVRSAINYLSNYDVKIVRMDDPSGEYDVPLGERVRKANNAKADILVSCHHNAMTGRWHNGGGIETFTYLGSQPGSTALAKQVHPRVVSAMGLSDRGIKQANFYMVRESHMPAILVEGGFMDSNRDIVSMRDDSKLAAQGVAVAKGIVAHLGLEKGESGAESSAPAPAKPASKPSTSKSISQMADEVEAGKHGSGHANRRKSLGVSASIYEKVRDEVNRRAGVKVTSKSKPKSKSVNQMAQEVIDGKHGSGHANRRRSLGVNSSTYAKVRAEVNRRAGVATSKPKGKSIEQMAQEVVAGKHGQGHANRQRSLGVNNATYQKVRARVNQMYQ